MTFLRDNKNYITLREAAKISGYSRDYLSSLIREGKVEGKHFPGESAWYIHPRSLEGHLASGNARRKYTERFTRTQKYNEPNSRSSFFFLSMKQFVYLGRPILWSALLCIAVIVMWITFAWVDTMMVRGRTSAEKNLSDRTALSLTF